MKEDRWEGEMGEMNNLQSILYDIRPCDPSSPYIFISYSNFDSELVWRDVREFQKRGFNVWLDEKNLDKTKPSWREDAIAAIEDMECELVVFYVSSHSLRSDSCYQELSKTVEERTKAMHFGPVKFIAVDAEPVGDITMFAQQVFQNIRGSGLDKDERSRQALALDGFMRDFFNSNNEKVRIHPKDEANRKIDYYDDITASFPDSTRIFEPEPEEEEVIPEPEPEEKEAIPEAEAGMKEAIPETGPKAEEAVAGENPEEMPAEENPDKVKAALIAVRRNLAAAHPDWDSKRLYAVTRAIVLGDQPEEKKEEHKEPAQAPDMNEILNTMNGIRSTESEQTAETGASESGQKTNTGRSESEQKPEVRIQEAEETAEETERTEETEEIEQTAAESGEEFLFTKSGEIPAGGPWKVFGKKEVRNTPIRNGVLEIPAGYTAIQVKFGHSLYWGNAAIEELILPDSLKELNIGEFQNCPKLKKVRLPGYLKAIPSDAFRECVSLKEIEIPGNVETIDSSVFYGCTSLQKIVFPEMLKSIGLHAFQGCTALQEIHLPPNLKKLSIHAFDGCRSLAKIHLPESLEKMDIGCFQDCVSLETITVPGSLKRISSSTFKNCTSLKTVILEEGVERIDGAFDRSGSGQLHIWIPDSVTSIDTIAFYKTALVIHCNEGSCAESYAKKNGYSFVLN